ncbi:MAG: hypothetical protein ACOCSE_02955 [Chitinivibrionales bacterium]
MKPVSLNILLLLFTALSPLFSASYKELRDCSSYRYLMFSDLSSESVGFVFSEEEKNSCINTITDVFSKEFDIPFKYINNKTIFSIRQCIVPMLLIRIDSIDVLETENKYKVNTKVRIIIFETPQCQKAKKEITLEAKGKYKSSKSKALSNNLLTASITVSNWLKGKGYL